MQPPGKIEEYVRSICGQIRWKKAQPRIAEEMTNHMLDQRDFLMTQGLDETAATEQAIENTGDAVEIGMQLDRIHRPKAQWTMLALTAALLGSGILIQVFLLRDSGSTWPLTTRLTAAAIGTGIMLIAYFSDFSMIGKYPRTIYFSIVTISILALMMSSRNGQIVFLGIQTCSLAYMVYLYPIAFAAILYTARNKGYRGILLSGFALCVPAYLSLLVPTVSAFMLFAICGIFLFSMAVMKNWFGTKRRYSFLLMLTPIGIAAGALFLTMGTYRWNRLAIAFNPSLDPAGMGYVATVTRALLQGSKLFGRGKMPDGYALSVFPMPNISTDSLLTYLIFHFGWIAFFVILGLFLFFILKGFMLCFRQKSSLGLFVSSAIMLTFTAQVIGYVLYNAGFQLFAPLSLPLISYGNVPTVINLGLIGLMLSVFRTGDAVVDQNTISGSKKLITYGDGKLTIHLKTQ